MNLTVCPLHGPRHNNSVGELMYLTVCPLHGPGYDSSVGEWMYLTVCPLYALGHDSSVREWMYLTVCPVVVLVLFPTVKGYFRRFFPGWSHFANPSCPGVTENGSISPQWHRTTCGHRGRKPTSTHWQTTAGKNWETGLKVHFSLFGGFSL